MTSQPSKHQVPFFLAGNRERLIVSKRKKEKNTHSPSFEMKQQSFSLLQSFNAFAKLTQFIPFPLSPSLSLPPAPLLSQTILVWGQDTAGALGKKKEQWN